MKKHKNLHSQEFNRMINFRSIYITAFSTIMSVLIVSCASTDLYEPVQSPQEAGSDRVIITGSRIGEEERSESDARRLQRQEQLAQATPRLVAITSEGKSDQGAQKKIVSWKPSTQADNNAVIKLGQDEEIKPQALDISIQIDGFRARVVIDGFYTNPHGRNLEGSFKFRLPDGAVPYFFAFGETATSLGTELKSPISFDHKNNSLSNLSPLSIMQQRSSHWLAPKEAIMVSKEKAAFAYNETVARQVDPALLEWAGAGVFSAKVFPLQAKKMHRVVLGYDLDLKRLGSDLMLDFPLTKESIQKRINLLINKKGAEKILLNRIIDDELKTVESISKNNELVQQTIEGTELSGIRVTVENHANVALVGEDEAGSFFAKQWKVDLPSNALPSLEKAVFAIDTSLSASPEKFHLWVDLVNKILTNNESEITEFAMISFNTDSHWYKKSFVENTARQRKKLLNYLNQLILEGATDLSSALNQAVAPDWLVKTEQSDANNRFDLYLLSDGAITWGEKQPFFITESIKKQITNHNTLNQIYTYQLGFAGESAALLSHLTREIGGGSYQLNHDTDINQLARAHRTIPWKIDSLKLIGAKDILINGRPNSVYPGQQITLVGRVSDELGDNIALTFSKGGLQTTVQVSVQQKIDSSLTSRVFGQIAVNQLESIAALERKVASAFANHFRVPGQSSSLLMLENQTDYQRYNIKPTEDAFIAGHKQVSDIFALLNDGFAKSLSNPKKRILDQIAKLEKMTFINFSLPDAVALLIEDMPKQAFKLDSMKLVSEKINNKRVPKKYLKQLQPDKTNYKVLQAEANRRLKKYTPQDGLKVLSSLVEQMPSDVAIIRDVAFTAESWGLYQQAFNLHLTAARLRPYEPQSYTYLAKLAHQLGNNDLALIYFEIGLASQWSNRFGDYELIHKIDYANFLRKSSQQTSDRNFHSVDYAKFKLSHLSKEINLQGSDLIVAISWNTDRTDIDLHIIEPSGEECYYSHNKTRSGGFITRDVTQGFGPEMYVNKKAPQGKYDVLVNYYASDQNKLGLKTKVMVRTIRNWGTDKEVETTKTVSLNDQKQKQRIAKIRI